MRVFPLQGGAERTRGDLRSRSFPPDSTAWNFDITHEMASTWAGTPRIRGSSSESVQMVLLTISLTGVQLVWGIEMACEFFLRRVWAGLIM
jgi:hypothetical protein